MTVIVKSAKTHPAAKKCCGWEEPAIWCPKNINFVSLKLANILDFNKSNYSTSKFLQAYKMLKTCPQRKLEPL